MKANYTKELLQSARTFSEIVWPEIGPLIGGGEFYSVEVRTVNGLRKILDEVAGIDGFQCCRDHKLVRSIASRIQYGPRSHDSFTIRYHRANGADTEWIKRLRAIHDPFAKWCFPSLTVQAYVSHEGHLLSACVVPTLALYRYAHRWLNENRPDRLFTVTNWRDGNSFIAVPWSGLEAENVPVRLWPQHEDVSGNSPDLPPDEADASA